MKQISWSALAEKDFTKQLTYLGEYTNQKAVLHYMAEVAHAIKNITLR